MKNKSSAIIAIVAIVVSAVVAVVAIVNNNNKGEQPSENNSSQNSTNNNSQASSIVGKWKYDDPNLADSFVYTFNADGTGNYSASGNFTYKIDGNKLSITYDATEATFDTEFEIDSDRLNIKDSFGDDTFYKRAE